MTVTRSAGWIVALAVTLGASTAVSAQKPAPVTSASSAKAKELVTALQAKKLEAFAVADPATPGRYVAVLHVPGAQLLVVAATYEKALEMDSRIYYKDFNNAYADLRTGIYAKDKLQIDDARGDGLVAVPGKDPLHDSVKMNEQQRTFDGDFVDAKHKNPKKISEDDYFKVFNEADQRYTRLLGLLLDAVKAS